MFKFLLLPIAFLTFSALFFFANVHSIAGLVVIFDFASMKPFLARLKEYVKRNREITYLFNAARF